MPFLPNEFYHVYNRGNNKQLLFKEDQNYRFFLRKIKIELCAYVDIIAYCLMPNHYHLLIYTDMGFNEEKSNILLRKLGTLQSSYTRAYNNAYNRSGSLFQQKLKHKQLDRNEHQALICFHYIHQNPLKAGFVSFMQEWQYSSFQSYLTCSDDLLLNKKVAYDLLAIPDSSEPF